MRRIQFFIVAYLLFLNVSSLQLPAPDKDVPSSGECASNPLSIMDIDLPQGESTYEKKAPVNGDELPEIKAECLTLGNSCCTLEQFGQAKEKYAEKLRPQFDEDGSKVKLIEKLRLNVDLLNKPLLDLEKINNMSQCISTDENKLINEHANELSSTIDKLINSLTNNKDASIFITERACFLCEDRFIDIKTKLNSNYSSLPSFFEPKSLDAEYSRQLNYFSVVENLVLLSALTAPYRCERSNNQEKGIISSSQVYDQYQNLGRTVQHLQSNENVEDNDKHRLYREMVELDVLYPTPSVQNLFDYVAIIDNQLKADKDANLQINEADIGVSDVAKLEENKAIDSDTKEAKSVDKDAKDNKLIGSDIKEIINDPSLLASKSNEALKTQNTPQKLQTDLDSILKDAQNKGYITKEALQSESNKELVKDIYGSLDVDKKDLQKNLASNNFDKIVSDKAKLENMLEKLNNRNKLANKSKKVQPKTIKRRLMPVIIVGTLILAVLGAALYAIVR